MLEIAIGLPQNTLRSQECPVFVAQPEAGGFTSPASLFKRREFPALIGKTISHYRIVEKLGQGGMGVVYIAEDTLLGRRVAIKSLHAAHADQHFRMRFLREAQAVSRLSHPHIATIHDYGET